MKLILLISILFINLQNAFAADGKNRLEELFIWKVSEELSLPPAQEKPFSDLIRELNKQRGELNEQLQSLLKKSSETKVPKERDALLAQYRKQLLAYNQLSVREFDQLQKILGNEKLSQYFALKSDLSVRIKSMLASPERKEGVKPVEETPTTKPVPPKVITQ